MQPGLPELAQKMKDGQVKTLVAIECNPAYDAPGDLDFAAALEKVAFRVHFAPWQNETSALCDSAAPRRASLGKLVGRARAGRHRQHRAAADRAAVRHAHRA